MTAARMGGGGSSVGAVSVACLSCLDAWAAGV